MGPSRVERTADILECQKVSQIVYIVCKLPSRVYNKEEKRVLNALYTVWNDCLESNVTPRLAHVTLQSTVKADLLQS